MTRWNKTTASYGCFYLGREHSRTKNAIFFFCPVRRIFSVSQSKNTGRPIRFELGSRDRSSCCCTKEWEWWRCFENQCKQTPKKSILDKRVGAEFLLSLVFENRFILTCSSDRITFLIILLWIMWSVEHRPFSSTCASVMSQSTFTL